MTGLDSAVAALLASRTDMLLSALNTQTSSTAPQANTSQLLVDTPRAATPAAVISAYAAPGPSTQTALSEIARTLDIISRFGGSATPALLGSSPLWPTAPRLILAASAFESLSGSLFSSSSANAASAVNPPAPPLPAPVLAAMLARTVVDSGLFYENHIALWLGGQRSLASLRNEPQARVDKLASELPSDSFPAAQEAAPDAWIDETLLPPTFTAAATPGAPNPMRPVPAPQTPQQAAALAASVREMPTSVFSSTAQGAAQGAGTAGTGALPSAAHLQDSAVQAAIASGIHPSTIPLVRQQLDVLASDQFRWSGEAWPGAKFEWEIQPQKPRSLWARCVSGWRRGGKFGRYGSRLAHPCHAELAHARQRGCRSRAHRPATRGAAQCERGRCRSSCRRWRSFPATTRCGGFAARRIDGARPRRAG